MIYAVLTGDIVDSTALDAKALDGLFSALDEAARDVSGWRIDAGTVRVGFRRRGGDGWQAALDAPHLALRTALYVRACLRREGRDRDSRVAIATGPGTLPEDGDTNRAHGPAFTASGRLLDDMPGQALMTHADGGAQAAATLLADHIARDWTEAQARALVEMLPPGSGPRAEAAARLGISRQAVDQALHAAGYPAISAALDALEAVGADQGADRDA